MASDLFERGVQAGVPALKSFEDTERKDLDPGLLEILDTINQSGWAITLFSCEGHLPEDLTAAQQDGEEDLPTASAYVTLLVDMEHRWRLLGIVLDSAVETWNPSAHGLDLRLSQTQFGSLFRLSVAVPYVGLGTYEAGDGKTVYTVTKARALDYLAYLAKRIRASGTEGEAKESAR